MNEWNPFDELLDQFAKFLALVESLPKDQMEMSENAEKSLRQLQKSIEAFNRLSEEIVVLSGISKEELAMRLNGTSKDLNPAAKRTLDKGNAVRTEAQRLREKYQELTKFESLSNQAVATPPADKPKQALTKEQEITKRRSKFKRFGGNEKWKPL